MGVLRVHGPLSTFMRYYSSNACRRVLLYRRGCKGQDDQVAVLLELSQEDTLMTSERSALVQCYFGVFNHSEQKITIHKGTHFSIIILFWHDIKLGFQFPLLSWLSNIGLSRNSNAFEAQIVGLANFDYCTEIQIILYRRGCYARVQYVLYTRNIFLRLGLFLGLNFSVTMIKCMSNAELWDWLSRLKIDCVCFDCYRIQTSVFCKLYGVGFWFICFP
jgi:hypothetical protein